MAARNVESEHVVSGYDSTTEETRGAGEVAVTGLLQRHGLDRARRVRAKIVSKRRRGTPASEVRDNVETNGKVFTDALTF